MKTEYLMSEWEADLNQLLRRWPLTAPLEALMPEIDLVLEGRGRVASPDDLLGLRLTVAMSFLWHRRMDSTIDNFLIVGSSGSVIKPALARALFRQLTATPRERLNEPLNSDDIIRLMADDKIGDRPLRRREGIDGESA